ncbi:hypothetical protein [Rhizobium sp. BK176]|uniref:hypothetical protein n=1 Tax=Rhizobium sp. BK176 TaxID=2587071 RepID=UPI0021688FDD|nr:hypothetical protein [Rhizobium sp. BK176]MCS4088870.1 hypothetical protein [Rhizobium sp. BK176]
MRIEIPFLSDIVGTIKGAQVRALAKATTQVELREIDLRDAPEAVIWNNADRACPQGQAPVRCGPGSQSTRWLDDCHWLAIEARTPRDLVQFGIIEAIHGGDPGKLAAKGGAKTLGSARKQFADIHSDNTDDTARYATEWAKRNIVTAGDTVLIRCHEPHYVVGCMFSNGRAVGPLLEQVIPTGFVRRKAFPIEHLFAADELDVACAVLSRIADDGINPDYLDGYTTDVEFDIAIPDSIRHPWHATSAAIAIDRLVETGRERLDQMSTDDVRQWISLARMRDAGIDTEEKALAAMQVADRMQLSLRVSPTLVRQFRDRLHMSVYGVNPNRDMTVGGPTP